MEEKQKTTLERKLLKIRNTGYYKENIEEFSGSYHANAYRMIVKMLEDIINNNFCNREIEEYNNPVNVLSFVGGRGSGKSSVMMSILGALENYNCHDKRMLRYFERFLDGRDVIFTCLDCIDGELLEKGEDIFKIVLAQIYKKFIDMEGSGNRYYNQDSYDYQKREVLKILERIYQVVCEIQAMNKETILPVSSASYLSSLDSLSSSQKVKKDFQRLIQIFTRTMENAGEKYSKSGKEHYIVISIDDIDLNTENGFDMLEKINRYLMVKNVIVMVTVDYSQMQRLAVKHFFNIFPAVDKILTDGEDYANRLAAEYLDKVLPINYRVYISSLGDRYTDEMTGIKRENTDLKQALLGKIYRRTGIRFDSSGIKKHFYQPGSMRQVTNFYLLLNKLNHIQIADIYEHLPKTEAEGCEIRNDVIQEMVENMDWMRRDLLERIAVDKLGPFPLNVKEFWKHLTEMDVRRAKNAVIYFLNDVDESESHSYVTTSEDATNEYSYGNLVEAIYTLGRIKNNLYKPLVHCLLAYFSYAFTREYLLETLHVTYKNSNETITKKGKMQELIGPYVAVEWAEDMLSIVLVENEQSIDAQEDMEKAILNSDKLIYYGHRWLWYVRAFGFNLPDLKIESLEDLGCLACNMEVLYCMITDVRDSYYTTEELWDKLKFDYEEGKSEELIIMLSFPRNSRGYFNVLNFISNYYGITERLEKFEAALLDVLVEVWKKIAQDECRDKKDEEIRKDVEEEVKKHSIVEKYKSWEMKYGKNTLPFPLHWFDMSYNILKRVHRYANENFPRYVKKTELESLCKEIQKIYMNINEQLKEQDEFYRKGSEVEISFQERFSSSPVAAYFMENWFDEKGDELDSVKEKRCLFWKSFFEQNILETGIDDVI